MKLYLCVTRDKYELPEVVADSVKELAEKCGVSRNAVAVPISKQRKGIYAKSRFHEVEVDDD